MSEGASGGGASGGGASSGALARARWLAHATELLEGLLNAAEPHQLEAFHAYRIKRPEVSVGDVAAARQLLLTIVGALDGSQAEAWAKLALAFDATVPEEPAIPSPLRASARVDTTLASPGGGTGGPIDSTMPAMAPPIRDVTAAMAVHVTQARPATHPPPATRVDATVALGELNAADLETATSTGGQGGTTPMTTTPQTILDIDKYAVLCAWTKLHPERREALHQQYGLDGEGDRKALDDHFEALFRQDARMRAAFAQRLNMHLKFVRASQG